MTTHKRNGLLLLTLLLITIGFTYSNHFYNEFHFDDFHSIVNNGYIRDLHNIPRYFVNPRMFSTDPTKWGLRPLVTTTLAVDYWLGNGLNPFWFQLSTFIWYLVLCICLYFLYRMIFQKASLSIHPEYPALTTTAWYALHKANAETINYIIARTDVLSTTCIVGSSLVFIAWPAQRKYLWYLLPALLGVFAKETVPVLIILIFFYTLLFEKQLSIADLFKFKNFKTIGATIWKLMPLIVVVGAAQLYTLSRISGIPGISNPPLYYILTQSYVWLHYFIAFFLPMNLSADTDWTVIVNVFDERIIIGLCFVIALVTVIVKTSRRPETRPVAFGLIWFAAALLPTSLAPFAEVTNDHRMFFPFIGLALSVVAYSFYQVNKSRYLAKGKRYQVYLYTIFLIIVCLNARGAHNRNRIWQDEESLWYDVTVKSPQNGRGMMNYGVVEMSKARYAIANRYFNAAKALLPGYSTIYLNIAVLKNALHQPLQAEENFKQAIALSPDNFENYEFYARFLARYNRDSEAEKMAEKALQLNPTSVNTLQILMPVKAHLQQWPQLQATAQQTLALWPQDAAAKSFLQMANAKMNL